MKTILFIDVVSEEKILLNFFKKNKSILEFLDTKEIKSLSNIKEALSGNNFHQIFLSLPLNLLSLRALDIPFKDKKKIEEVLEGELSQTILDDIDEVVYKSFYYEFFETSTKVYVAYLKRNKLKEILWSFYENDIKVDIVTSLELSALMPISENIAKVIDFSFSRENFEEYAKLIQKEISKPILNFKKEILFKDLMLNTFKKYINITIVLLFVLLSIIVLNFGLRIYENKKKVKELENIISSEIKKVLPHANVYTVSVQLKSIIKELKEKEIFIDIPVLEILKNIKVSSDVNIDEIIIGSDSILINGNANSMVNINEFKTQLSSKFNSVSISETKRLSEKIFFTVTLKYKRI